MKTLLAGIAALSALTASVAHAVSAEVPAQYRGIWCYSKNANYLYRCREALGEGDPYIDRNSIQIDEEGSCPIAIVEPTAKGHRLTLDCHPNRVPEPPKYIDLRLDARGHLHFGSK
jgi:hypothetical protein